MLLFRTDQFTLPLPATHRFPIGKYRLLRVAVEESGLFPPGNVRTPDPATDEQLLRVHDAGYLERMYTGALDRQAIRRLGFPWSPELVERSRRSVGGTIGACRSALDHGFGINLAGGTHHAFADRGEGFCVFNDVAVAIRELQATEGLRRALIIDCDVHQGDGTAALFADDRSVLTLSIHGRGNYPLRKEVSDLDVALEDGTDDAGYLAALRRALTVVERLPAFELAVFVAGVDPYVGDRLGRLAVSAEGLAERDRLVLESCHRRGLPTAVVMGGGYAPEIDRIVALHLATVRAVWRRWCSTIRPEIGGAVQL